MVTRLGRADSAQRVAQNRELLVNGDSRGKVMASRPRGPTRRKVTALKGAADEGTRLAPLVGVLGGSKSDFPVLQKAVAVLTQLGIPCELLVVSAHRTPDRLFEYAERAAMRGIEVIVAGAGGAAHLPGMLAAKTHLPVIGIPIPTESLKGLDSLLSIVQMPRGVPVATVAIGGAENAGLLAGQILAGRYRSIRDRLLQFRAEQTRAVLAARTEVKGLRTEPRPSVLSPQSSNARRSRGIRRR